MNFLLHCTLSGLMSVCQLALHVWKSIVANTPKTLLVIMKVLLSKVMSLLASSSSEIRQVAGQSLVELFQKHGERFLYMIFSILSKGVKDPDAIRRQVAGKILDVLIMSFGAFPSDDRKHGTSVMALGFGDSIFVGADSRGTDERHRVSSEFNDKTFLTRRNSICAVGGEHKTGCVLVVIINKLLKEYPECDIHGIMEIAYGRIPLNHWKVVDVDTDPYRQQFTLPYEITLCGFNNEGRLSFLQINVLNNGVVNLEPFDGSEFLVGFSGSGTDYMSRFCHHHLQNFLVNEENAVNFLQLALAEACLKDPFTGGYLRIVQTKKGSDPIISPGPQKHNFSVIAENESWYRVPMGNSFVMEENNIDPYKVHEMNYAAALKSYFSSSEDYPAIRSIKVLSRSVQNKYIKRLIRFSNEEDCRRAIEICNNNSCALTPPVEGFQGFWAQLPGIRPDYTIRPADSSFFSEFGRIYEMQLYELDPSRRTRQGGVAIFKIVPLNAAKRKKTAVYVAELKAAAEAEAAAAAAAAAESSS